MTQVIRIDHKDPTYLEIYVSPKIKVGETLFVLGRVVDMDENGLATVLVMDDEAMDALITS